MNTIFNLLRTAMTLLLLAVACLHSLPSFVGEPALTKDINGVWWVEFEVSEATDVAVSIVNIHDSSVIRNLAAGVLGTNAPAPLSSGSLHQKIQWDHRDNYGQAVAVPDSLLRGRVRAGMRPVLASLLGGNPYTFGTSFHGLKVLKDGSFYLAALNISLASNFGNYEGANVPIRQFASDGSYLRTVFPLPANLPLGSVSALGVAVTASGWSPLTATPNYGTLTTHCLLTEPDAQLVPNGEADEILLGTATAIQTLRVDGTAAANDVPHSLSPELSIYTRSGPVFYSVSHSPDYIYMSGLRYAAVAGASSDTGFWADGQVFKVSKTTGTVTPWLAVHGFPLTQAERDVDIISGAYFGVLEGIDIDDSGHVFVCDRFNKRIGIYDTNAVLQGAVPIRYPDVVAVDKKTGSFYVLTRTATALTLCKFGDWKAAPTAPLYSITVESGSHMDQAKPFMAIAQEDGKNVLFTGAGFSWSPKFVRKYSDDGTKLALVKDILTILPSDADYIRSDALLDYNRIAVDRRNETVYIQNGWTGLFKIEDWSNPVALRCSTSAGISLQADDMALDTKRGYLYVRQNIAADFRCNPITRFTLDHRHQPAPFANTGSDTLTPFIGSGDVQGHPTRGMDVSPVDGTVLINHRSNYGGFNLVSLFADSGSRRPDTLGKVLIRPLPARSGGAKFDLQGNYYIGTQTRNANHVIPTGFASDPTYQNAMGAVVKYAAGSSGHAIGNLENWTQPYDGLPLIKSTDGALKVYTSGYSPFGGNGWVPPKNYCNCRTPRFDVDDYGRIFIPNAITKEVSVVDNNDNLIMKFGQYGNVDSRGGLPGLAGQQTVATPAFPLAYPICAAASEDYIYVGDMVNWRMMRVRMDYVLDNIQGFSGETGIAGVNRLPAAGLSLACSPNPLNSRSRISVYAPVRTRLAVEIYDLKGQRVKQIAQGDYPSGVNLFAWAGDKENGQRAASGVYLCRLTAGATVKTIRTVLAK